MSLHRSFSILFHIRKDKNNAEGLAPAYCRITVDGSRSELVVQRSIAPHKWNPTNGTALGKTAEARSHNAFIDTMRVNVHGHHRLLVESS